MSKLLLALGTALTMVASPAIAGLGDKLYVQKNGVNVRNGPGTNSDVTLTLGTGHELVEFSRKGGWVNVGITRTGGKDGWIHSSLVGSTSPEGPIIAPADGKFDAFVEDVEKLNSTVEPVAGFTFFTEVENLGDGIIQLKAHRQWLAAPRADRESNLNTLFNLWSTREASGLPIAVLIVDSSGRVVMERKRKR